MRIPVISFNRINFNLYHHYNSFRVNESLLNLYKIPRNSINFQKSFFSTNIRDISNNNSNNVETKPLIFEGPNFRLIRILKIFSISTFGVRIKLRFKDPRHNPTQLSKKKKCFVSLLVCMDNMSTYLVELE